MSSATILPTSVSQKVKGTWVSFTPGDEPVKGAYGYSLSVGCKNDETDEWDNYFVNDPQLFDYFAVGESVVVEYERKGKFNVIGGVGGPTSDEKKGSPSGAVAAAGESNSSRQRSIELQVLVKAYADMYVASSTFGAPEELAANVTAAHERIFVSAGDKVKMFAEFLEAERLPVGELDPQ